MNNKTFICLIFCLTLIVFGCSKDGSGSRLQASDLSNAGATQVSGIGYFDATDACGAVAAGASYAVTMDGGIEGCLITYVDDFKCQPSGTYYEVGHEHFIGTYNGQYGEFWTTYKYEAKFEGCAENGSYIGAEIKGRCQHPIVNGSGTGVFEGVDGWIAFKDDIEAGNYPYRGHLKF